MLSTERLIELSGDVRNAGEFKASRQYLISCPLPFDDIKAFFDGVVVGADYTYEDEQSYEHGPHATYYIKGPNASYENRWQIDILRADDEEAMDDIGSYLAIDIEDYITKGNMYLIVIFDNNKAFEAND